ncbi:MAG: DUF2384 domain-containing protein [Gammaproteobacteria bacterium]|nr:DUF2384 domain-containing protein [Rhodospirillaceae bacterium]MDE0365335.1 DUF2384 domain-containing protein [Gammaproteobacteria bacterium]
MPPQIQLSQSEGPVNEATRVARLLAIDDPEVLSEVQLAHCVSSGLPSKSALGLSEVLGKRWVVGSIIPEASLRRARKSDKPLSRELSERLYEIGRVVDALRLAYHGNKDAIDGFLHRPHVLLEGDTPFDLARSSSAGAQAVLNLIRRAEAGVAV